MPERSTTNERRAFVSEVTAVRQEADDATNIGTLSGYAAVFNSEIVMGKYMPWREMIAPGAFKDSLRDDDPRGLVNHDTNLLLARQSSGTLRLKEDKKGLKFDMDLPDTTYARDLLAVVERGDLTGMSFGFDILGEERSDPADDDEQKIPLFTIKRVKLHEVSPVTFPAYEATSVTASTRDRREEERAPAPAQQPDVDIRLRMARLDDTEESLNS